MEQPKAAILELEMSAGYSSVCDFQCPPFSEALACPHCGEQIEKLRRHAVSLSSRVR